MSYTTGEVRETSPVLGDNELPGVHGEGGHGDEVRHSDIDWNGSVLIWLCLVDSFVVGPQLVDGVNLADAVGGRDGGLVESEDHGEVPVEKNARIVLILRAPVEDHDLRVVVELAGRLGAD